MKIMNLNLNELQKKLIADYMLALYEDNAIIDDEHIEQEYLSLRGDNNLEALFRYQNIVSGQEL